MPTSGIVRDWNADEGWGVVDVDDIRGGIWVHFSAIDGRSFGYLTPGESVTVEWEEISHPPFPVQATRVIPEGKAGSATAGSNTGVLNSHLTIEWDEDRKN
jgi:CspA family cold shock protein